MNLDSLYQHSPTWLQNVAVSLYGAQLNLRRYNRKYKKLEARVFARDFASADAILELQKIRLQELLFFCQSEVPYYRNLFSTLGCDYRDFKNVSDLSLLPILTKDIVKSQIEEFYPSSLNKLKFSWIKTSGTTGAGLVFPMTVRAEMEQWAVWWRYRARFGIDHNTWYAHFYGKSIVPLTQQQPPFWRINRPGKQIFFSAYHMTDTNMAAYIEALNRYTPPWVQGYPSILAIVAEYILSGKLKLTYSPKIITVGSESLLPQQKEKIESAFGAPCRQHYGMTEAVGNISECEHGHLHIDEDFGYIEMVENSYGARELVCTGFANRAFPLIRYTVGDVVELSNQSKRCACGRNSRIVEAIDGRIEDYVVTPEGKKVGRLDHIFKDFMGIKECQIFQSNTEEIEIRVVKGSAYHKQDEERLIAETRSRLGTEIGIKINYYESLERSNTGKLRFVISALKNS